MKARFGIRRGTVLLTTLLVALSAAVLPGTATADGNGNGDEHGDGHQGRSDHWGVITRNTIGSPVAELRNGPFGSFGVLGPEGRPPYGRGSLGIEVAGSTTTTPATNEKVDFGNEVDFFSRPVSSLKEVGFHVFQTGENVDYGGPTNMPNIRFEIDPNLAAPNAGITYSTLVWVPAAAPVTNRWTDYLDATETGTWFLTGAAGVQTNCEQSDLCDFDAVMAALQDGGEPATIYSAAVGKGRDFMWIGAVDGLRINETIYDFEPWGVRPRPVL
ncbi:hypothetical protein PV381_24175 [Streptomyces scabiei]|uniref:hypothetical protein n=1 Tax=Streptomyces scabiei TaxID=1930 RepID=UPI0029BF1373|nr:hypothetical protein [Streptomyces scabiei]MDX2629617.1 hypothetical protein [Streptomyces scabiei]